MRLMIILHVSFVFLRIGFCNWKKAVTSFRNHQQSKCHLAALTFEVTVDQCLDAITIANFFAKSKGNRKRLFGKFTKRTCRIIITNFLLSFITYLVSLSLCIKLVYKVLFKRHLIFVANITPVFLSLHKP